MDLETVMTPALVLERRAVERNCARMCARAAELGVRLRPHLKTAKSAEVARLATAGQFGGITVSTVAEAAYFAAHGFKDILYAVGAHPSKLARLAELVRRGVAVTLIASDPDIVPALDAEARRLGVDFPVLVEIDSGGRRAGLEPEEPALLAVAAALQAASHLQLEGVLTHAGNSYGVKGADAIAAVAEQERAAAVRAAQRLRAAGHAAPTVSVGSTPTALHARTLDGVTELRAGVYTLFDLDQHVRGLCGLEDVAASVLASVIGHNLHTGRILIDAGALALSKDLSAASREPDIAYGVVVELLTNTPYPGLHVNEAFQEHGCIRVGSQADFDRLPVGSRVRVLPNHACMTVAPYDRFYVRSGATTAVETVWDKAVGW